MSKDFFTVDLEKDNYIYLLHIKYDNPYGVTEKDYSIIKPMLVNMIKELKPTEENINALNSEATWAFLELVKA